MYRKMITAKLVFVRFGGKAQILEGADPRPLVATCLHKLLIVTAIYGV